MSGLGGFDFVIEFSREGLVELVSRNLRLGGQDYRPPTEIVQTIPDGQGGGTLSFVLVGVDVSVRGGPDNRLDIVLLIERLSIIRPGQRDLTGLRGTITLQSRVDLRPHPMDRTRRLLVLTLANIQAVASIPGQPTVAHLLGIGLTEALRPDTRLMRTVPNPSMELPLRVDASGPASLNPLVVNALTIGFVTNPDPAQQALGLFARFGSALVGEPPRRTARVVPAGDDLGIVLSAGTFLSQVLCPAVQAGLRVAAPELLPRTCGQAESVPLPALPRASITRVAGSLADGRVDLEIRGRIRQSEEAFGNTVEFSLWGSLTLEVAGDRVVPRWRTTSASTGQTFGPGHWVLGIAILPYFILMGTAAGVTGSGASTLERRVDIGSYLTAISLAGLLGPLQANLSHVSFSTTECLLTARMRRPPARSRAPTLTLHPTMEVLTSKDLETGVYESQGCPSGSYPWTRRRQFQRLRIVPRSQLATRPVSYRWEVGLGPAPPTRLEGASGQVTGEVETTFGDAFPPRRELRRVPLDWTVEQDGSLVVTNDPDDGSFHAAFYCTATDAEGRVSTQSFHGDFTGDTIELDPSYSRDLADCLQRAQEQIDGLRSLAGPDEGFVVPGEGLITDHELRRYVVRLSRLADRGDKELAGLEVAFGHMLAEVVAADTTSAMELGQALFGAVTDIDFNSGGDVVSDPGFADREKLWEAEERLRVESDQHFLTSSKASAEVGEALLKAAAREGVDVEQLLSRHEASIAKEYAAALEWDPPETTEGTAGTKEEPE